VPKLILLRGPGRKNSQLKEFEVASNGLLGLLQQKSFGVAADYRDCPEFAFNLSTSRATEQVQLEMLLCYHQLDMIGQVFGAI